MNKRAVELYKAASEVERALERESQEPWLTPELANTCAEVPAQAAPPMERLGKTRILDVFAKVLLALGEADVALEELKSQG